jgi:hypothetical protein
MRLLRSVKTQFCHKKAQLFPVVPSVAKPTIVVCVAAPANRVHPTWSSDSQFIYFLLPWDDPGVLRVRVSGGNAERVIDLKGFRFTGAVNLWMGLDLTDTPMLIRDVGTDDIYALTLEQK